MELLQYTYKYTLITSIDKQTGEEIEGYYPLMPCQFKSHRKTTRIVDGLLDTGSDGILIPKGMADYLELSLKGRKAVKGVGGEVPGGTATVDVILGSQARFTELRSVEVRVPLEGYDGPVLLGRKPIFELYDVSFIEGDLRFALVPHEKGEARGRRKKTKRKK